MFDRVLETSQLAAIERYLREKHGDNRKVKIPPLNAGSKPLKEISDAPELQMFVPGFRVQPLPIEMTNVNNLKYRSDGKLVALAYNGDIHLLSNTDGDGIEDRVETFWKNQGGIKNPIGMALTPKDYAQGNGIFVASIGKLSLIVDTDGDDRADRQEALAEGWEPIPHGVDALGVAFDDRDGSVYYGLGAAEFTNAYQPDAQGKSRYDRASERGTILRVDPATKKREIVCTGIRFPVALAFNRHHDLFCTDQEGATWLPNGNPFDELLHIEPKRHYGFPPRHPRHLPDVIDEPSVCDYGPQHQSTCGLNFNEPVNGGPVFGPKAWQGDALVCGYSRGKLYRTQLVKTPLGYVSRNHLLASLKMLTCDACVSPAGDLVVAVHSGGPDWGSGPNGKGKLYRVRYSDPDAPQPVAVWPQSSQEVHVAFDRPLSPEQLQKIGAGIEIDYGRFVTAGDRFEVMRPGYQVVFEQRNSPRNALQVHSVGVTPDRRTLVISTAPHPQAVNYAVTIPSLTQSQDAATAASFKQKPETDLAYDLNGIAARWTSEDGSQMWAGWLPHLDFEVARAFTAGSAPHDELWRLAGSRGSWQLETSLDVKQLLRPAVQPGARLDEPLPPEQVTIQLTSRAPLKVTSPALGSVKHSVQDGLQTVSLKLPAGYSEPLPLSIAFSSAEVPDLRIAYFTGDDARPRALPLARMLLPWAAGFRNDVTEPPTPSLPKELAGGNWARGRRLFFGEQAACFKCHKYGGVGESVGPDLSNLPHRDYASVLRDIEQPSFAINPDHLAHNVQLDDGRVLSGVLRHRDGKTHLIDQQGKTTILEEGSIESMAPSTKSIMPEGLPKLLGPEPMRDLLTFLLTPPPSMPLDGTVPPFIRTRAEVEKVLAGSAPPTEPLKPLRMVLVSGAKDHGPGEHDYPKWQETWSKLLSLGEVATVTTATDWPSAEDFQKADVMLFYQQGKWSAERAAAIDAYLARGGGLVYIHYAVDGGGDPVGMAERVGLAWRGNHSRFRHGPLDLEFRDSSHPIARNFSRVHFHDESYWQLVGDPGRINLLASGSEDGQSQPLIWTAEQNKGRVFVSILGHYSWTFDDPLFRVLLLRGTAWAAGESVDRFNDLVYPGARMN